MQLIPPLTTDHPKVCSEYYIENLVDEKERTFNFSFRLNLWKNTNIHTQHCVHEF